jgi:hypothetical protein
MNKPNQKQEIEGARGYSLRKDTGVWQVLHLGVVVKEFMHEELARLFFNAWCAGRNPSPEQVAAALNGLWTQEAA